jgi:uncharacterized protein YlxP (DUF503 family)
LTRHVTIQQCGDVCGPPITKSPNHNSEPMVIGILQVELGIDEASSLKDKRRVVSSIKARLHREHQVSVAEVGMNDDCTTAMIGIAAASSDVSHAQHVLAGVLDKLKFGRGWSLRDHQLEVLSGK